MDDCGTRLKRLSRVSRQQSEQSYRQVMPYIRGTGRATSTLGIGGGIEI
jgi:hypothetical protein